MGRRFPASRWSVCFFQSEKRVCSVRVTPGRQNILDLRLCLWISIVKLLFLESKQNKQLQIVRPNLSNRLLFVKNLWYSLQKVCVLSCHLSKNVFFSTPPPPKKNNRGKFHEESAEKKNSTGMIKHAKSDVSKSSNKMKWLLISPPPAVRRSQREYLPLKHSEMFRLLKKKRKIWITTFFKPKTVKKVFIGHISKNHQIPGISTWGFRLVFFPPWLLKQTWMPRKISPRNIPGNGD